jgi:hypothetical protein
LGKDCKLAEKFGPLARGLSEELIGPERSNYAHNQLGILLSHPIPDAHHLHMHEFRILGLINRAHIGIILIAQSLAASRIQEALQIGDIRLTVHSQHTQGIEARVVLRLDHHHPFIGSII